MSRFFTLLLAVLLMPGLVELAGCASTSKLAPIRDASRAPLAKPAPPARLPASPISPGQYRIQPGDTLYKIAFEQGLDYRDLAAWNGVSDPGSIRAGELLRLTPPKRPPPSPTVRGMAETAEEAAPTHWAWPCQGDLLARFGVRFGTGFNKGIDIAGRRGQPVQASAPGRVVYAGAGLRGYGKLIIIRHGKTLLSAYAHADRILVAEGQDVGRAQVIAEMGDSDADRVKLHFEIREYGKAVDPLDFLPKKAS